MAITIRDIAKEAGVSIATVSRYINGTGYVKSETKALVEAAIDKYNYIPNAAAVSLSKRESNVIGVIVPEVSDLFNSQVIKGVNKLADKENLAVILSDSGGDIQSEMRALKVFKQQQVRGLIMIPAVDEYELNQTFFDGLSKADFPVVCIDREVNGFNVDGFYYNNYLNSYKAAKYLHDLGHTEVVVVAGDQNIENGRQRLDGFINAYDDFDLEIPDENILYGEFDEDLAYQLTKEYFMDKTKVKAIFSSNSLMTKGVIKALFELKLEKKVKIFSFDKHELFDVLNIESYYFERNPKKLGEEALALLLKRMNNEDYEFKKVLVPLSINKTDIK